MQPKYTTWTFIWNVHILYLNWDIRNKTNAYKIKINNWNNNKKRNLMTWKQSRKSWCSFVCICSFILKKAEENWTIRTLSMSVCAHKTPHTTFYQLSRASFTLALCLEVVLTSSRDTWDWTRMHMLVVMHRRTLRENVYSVKIRWLFILQISIFYAWNRYIVWVETWSMYRSIHIDVTLHPYETGWWNETPSLQSLEIFF